MHFSKIFISAFLCASYLFTSYFVVVIALLFKNNRKGLCHLRYDHVRLVVYFWQSQKVWYFHCLMQRQVNNLAYWILCIEAQPQLTILHPGAWGRWCRSLSCYKQEGQTTVSSLNQSLKQIHNLFGKKINK